jgi:hypothetical protein
MRRGGMGSFVMGIRGLGCTEDRSNVGLNPVKQHEHQQDEEDQTQSAAWVVTPGPAMRPSGQNSDKHEEQAEKQYDTKHDEPFEK